MKVFLSYSHGASYIDSLSILGKYHLLSVRSVEEKRIYAERLDELWPDIRCRVNDQGHLCVYYLATRVQKLPATLGFSAHYVERVRRRDAEIVDVDGRFDRGLRRLRRRARVRQLVEEEARRDP